MSTGFDSAARQINGTYGEVWLDNEAVGECYGLQAKVSHTKEDVPMPGTLMVDTKVKSSKGTGTMKMYKTNSRMAIKLAAAHKEGRIPRFLIVSKLADPESYGAERVALKSVSFDDQVLADWEAGNLGKVESPFTFPDYEYLDMIGVQ